MTRPGGCALALVAAQLAAAWVGVPAQSRDEFGREPRFLLESAGKRVLVDVTASPSLQRRIALELSNATLAEAIRQISRQSGMAIVFSSDALPRSHLVSLSTKTATVADALTTVLAGTQLDVILRSDGSAALAQRRAGLGSIEGHVTSKDTGLPIEGALVTLRGNRLAAVTDVAGRYRIGNVPTGTYVVFARRLGFTMASADVTVDDTPRVVDFAFETGPTHLAQVLVTGAGTFTIRERLAVGINTVDSGMIRRAMTPNNVTSALAGTAPGVVVRTQSGEPGASAAIQIRGNSSLSGTGQPLFVVDGAPIDNSVTMGSNNNGGNAGVVSPNRAVDINPNDIESVEILKGPAAAAIYGARAVNGVILITTKRAHPAETRVTITTSVSRDDIVGRVPTQRLYGQGSNGAPPAAGCGSTVALSCTRLAWGPRLSPTTATFDQVGLIVRPGVTADYNVMVSGGSDRTLFLASLGLTNQRGFFVGPHNWYNRTTARVKGSHVVNDALFFRGNVSVIDARGAAVQRGDNQRSTVLGGALRTPPDFSLLPLYALSGGARSVERPTPSAGLDTFNIGTSPLFLAYNQPNSTELSRVIGSGGVTWSPMPWLRVEENLSADSYDDNRLSGYPYGTNSVPNGAVDRMNFSHLEVDHALIATATNEIRSWWENTLIVGHNLNSRRNRSLMVEGTRLIAPLPYALGNVAEFTATEVKNLAHIQSFYLQNEASLYDQLYVTAGLRRDGYSTFGAQNPKAIFPRASLAWNVTHFLRSHGQSGPLSYLKLRGGYGETGKEPPLYAAVDAFTAGTIFVSAGDPDDIQAIGGLTSSPTRGNPGLRPERQRELELGVDVGLFSQKVAGSFTYYAKNARDIILNVATGAAETGYTSAFMNAGALRNRGVELQVNLHPWTSENLSVDFGLQFARNRGKTLALAKGLREIPVGGFGAGLAGVARIGYQPGAFRGQDFVRCGRGLKLDVGLGGVSDIDALCAATPGEYKRDALFLLGNGQPVVDPTQRIVGDPNPDYTWGINTSVRLRKHLLVSALFDGRMGGDVWNGTRATSNAAGIHKDTEMRERSDGTFGVNFLTDVYPNVAGPGKGIVAFSTLHQWQAWFSGAGGSSGPVAQYIEDGSFVKLRELSVSYQWDHPAFQRYTAFSTIDVRFGARNLVTWTRYTGFDPETNLAGALTITQGIDWFAPPQTRSLMVGVALNR